MICPECGYEQECPCSNCQARLHKNSKIKPWIWVDGELIKCANCGLLKHADWWMDVEMKQYEDKT
jgi:hypothetical protein